MMRSWLIGALIALGGGLALVPDRRADAARRASDAEKPRLVVLVVFDQMRGDYLGRWQDLFLAGGFRRLMGNGAWFQNCHYPYANTMTGPGHATLATGCPPMTHGIVGNDWYDRKLARSVNCVGSDRHAQVPLPLPDEKDKEKKTEPPKKGVSPDRLLAPTLADAMKEQLGEEVRVVCLSLKDRSSSLPGGKQPDACYWADKHGRMVTSDYYRAGHRWVRQFNLSGVVDRWHGKDWQRLRDDIDYVKRAGPDEVTGEGKGNHQGLTFPHPFGDGPKKERTNYYAALANSPFGNEVLLELAKKAIVEEKLGQRDKPDFLSISFSSNDLVGHAWGPDSQEVLDITLRSDRIVKELLDYLDARVGTGKYVLALSADHGICPLPEVKRSKGVPARRVDPKPWLEKIETHLDKLYPAGKDEGESKARWVAGHNSNMLYFDRKRLARRGVAIEKAAHVLARWITEHPGFAAAYTQADLVGGERTDEFIDKVRLSFQADRSGDVMYVNSPYCFVTTYLTGTTHGSPHSYDTHVPLFVFGPGIKAGVRKEHVSPEHAAVILARSLGIKPPARARQKVPDGLFEK